MVCKFRHCLQSCFLSLLLCGVFQGCLKPQESELEEGYRLGELTLSTQGFFEVTPSFYPTTAPNTEEPLLIRLPIHSQMNEPVPGATVGIKPWLPSAARGVLLPPKRELSEGVFIFSDIFFPVPGDWELHVYVDCEGILDSFNIPVLVSGP